MRRGGVGRTTQVEGYTALGFVAGSRCGATTTGCTKVRDRREVDRAFVPRLRSTKCHWPCVALVALTLFHAYKFRPSVDGGQARRLESLLDGQCELSNAALVPNEAP